MAQIISRGRNKWLVRVFLGCDENGQRQFQNRTITGTKKDAQDWARDRERDRDLLGPAAVKALNLTVGGLLEDLEAHYRINNPKSADWCALMVKVHLRPFFEKMSVSRVGSDEIRQYIADRRERGIANSTINRELALLRRAFNLAAKADPPKVTRVPRIPKLEENNVREGFFEDAEYRALMEALPAHLRPVLAFGYFTGCRRGEVLRLRWSQVDLIDGVVRLEAGTTKNDDARMIPLAPDLLEVLRIQRARRDSVCPACPWVFFYDDGKRIVAFRGSWFAACKAAGLWKGDESTGKPTRLFHDLRRSAVRNLVRGGAPEQVAQRISGHRTRSTFERYNITTEADLREAARRLQDYLRAKREAEAGEGQTHTESARIHTIVTQTEEGRPC